MENTQDDIITVRVPFLPYRTECSAMDGKQFDEISLIVTKNHASLLCRGDCTFSVRDKTSDTVLITADICTIHDKDSATYNYTFNRDTREIILDFTLLSIVGDWMPELPDMDVEIKVKPWKVPAWAP